MRAKEFLSEDQPLSPAGLTKEMGRFNNLIADIRSGAPLFLADGNPVVIEPNEADRLLDLQTNGKFGGRGITLKQKDVTKSYPIGAFLKTKRYGGDAIPPGQEKTMEPTKSGAKLKPKDIGLHDQQIAAGQLGKLIASNTSLQQTPVGQAVIKIANEISAKRPAIMPKGLHSKEISAINDNAGEYLGVLALVEGMSKFDHQEDFQKWLGTSIGSLTLLFPGTNNPIADSYALINQSTGHQINISSKGSGGGAPPAISGLKIPEHILAKKQYEIPVKFIQLCQPEAPLPDPRTVSQPFYVMNMLNEYKPGVIPEQYKQFLPWGDDVIARVNRGLKTGEAMPEYAHLWSKIDFRSEKAVDGGKLTHVVKNTVMEIFNSGKIPEFAPAVLEILDYNFIQQDAVINKGVMNFTTHWPAHIRGDVTVESKSGAPNPAKGGFSFKLKF